MELIKTEPEKQAFASLNDIQQYYVRLKLEPPIASIESQSYLKDQCFEIVCKAHIDRPPKDAPTEKLLKIQAQILYNELSGKFKSLTLSEIKEAFRLGVRGESGPYYGFCGVTYHQFIKWWFDKTDRGKAWELYIAKVNGWKLAEKPALSKQFFFDACERAFTKYMERREMPEVPFCLYDFIKEYTGEETLIDRLDYPKIKAEALKLYTDKIKHSALKEMAKGWKLIADETNPDFNRVYANSIKHIATKYYFQSLIEQGKTTIK